MNCKTLLVREQTRMCVGWRSKYYRPPENLEIWAPFCRSGVKRHKIFKKREENTLKRQLETPWGARALRPGRGRGRGRGLTAGLDFPGKASGLPPFRGLVSSRSPSPSPSPSPLLLLPASLLRRRHLPPDYNSQRAPRGPAAGPGPLPQQRPPGAVVPRVSLTAYEPPGGRSPAGRPRHGAHPGGVSGGPVRLPAPARRARSGSSRRRLLRPLLRRPRRAAATARAAKRSPPAAPHRWRLREGVSGRRRSRPAEGRGAGGGEEALSGSAGPRRNGRDETPPCWRWRGGRCRAVPAGGVPGPGAAPPASPFLCLLVGSGAGPGLSPFPGWWGRAAVVTALRPRARWRGRE